MIQAYVVFRGGGKEDAVGKLQGTTGKFIGKTCRTQGTSNQTNSISLQQGNFTDEADGVTVRNFPSFLYFLYFFNFVLILYIFSGAQFESKFFVLHKAKSGAVVNLKNCLSADPATTRKNVFARSGSNSFLQSSFFFSRIPVSRSF